MYRWKIEKKQVQNLTFGEKSVVKLNWPVALICASFAQITMAQTVDLVLPETAPEDLETAVRAASLTLSLGGDEPAQAQDYVAAARADYRRILTGLFGQGYYGPTVSIRIDGREASTIAPLDAPPTINTITITVDPGQEFAFGRTDLAPVPPETELPADFSTGNTARADVIRTATQTAVTGWREAGYALAASGDQQITANHAAGILDVTVQIIPGQQLTFGTVTIGGNVDVRTERVREIAGVPIGEIYSPNDIARVQTRLRRTGTFSSVAVIESDVAAAGDTLPIDIEVIEEAPRRVGFGAEYSTLEGATLSAFWLHRNLLGGAERFRVEGEASGIAGETGGVDYRIGATFGRPATFRPDIDLTISTALQHLDEPDFTLDQFSFDVGLIQYEDDRTTYTAGIGLLTARERSDVRERSYTLLSLPLSATRDGRDVPLNPTSGYYYSVEARPFVGIEGIGSGGRLYGDARYYITPGASDFVTLAGRLQAGSVLGASITDSPSDFLFYSGGGGTVRGQEYQSLGIDVTQDFGAGPETSRSGGTAFLGGQLEARVNVTEAIGVVGFYDFGIVGDDTFVSSEDEWHAGAGLGVRYNTGLGPIRLDIGTPASGDNALNRVEVYIGIGQSF